jgi:hypothetical protein
MKFYLRATHTASCCGGCTNRNVPLLEESGRTTEELDSSNNVLSRVCVTIDGVCIGEYIYWPLVHTAVTTSNYNGIVNPDTSQITGTHIKIFQFVFSRRFLVTDLNNEDSSVSVLTSLLSGEYSETELSL